MRSAVPEASLRLGLRLAGLHRLDEGVELTITDGSREVADVVIGADGVHTTVGRFVAEAEAQAASGRLEGGPGPVDLVTVLLREAMEMEDEHRQDPVCGRASDAEFAGDVHHAELVAFVQQLYGTQGVTGGAHRMGGIPRRGILGSPDSVKGNHNVGSPH